MRLLLLVPVIYVIAVVETSLVDAMQIGHVAPDLLALAAIAWLLVWPGPRAFLVAGGIALFGDAIAPGRLGVGAAWMLLIGYGISRLRPWLKAESLVARVAIVAVAVTAWAAAVGMTARVIGDVSLPWTVLLQRAAGVGAYTAGVSLPVFMLLAWIRETPAVARRELEDL